MSEWMNEWVQRLFFNFLCHTFYLQLLFTINYLYYRWVEGHREELLRHGSTLEFKLKQRKYLLLLSLGQINEALTYAKVLGEFSPLHNKGEYTEWVYWASILSEYIEWIYWVNILSKYTEYWAEYMYMYTEWIVSIAAKNCKFIVKFIVFCDIYHWLELVL